MKDTLLLRAVVGSQAYGTNLPTSDIDEKFVYAQPQNELITFGYKQQIEVSKDNVGYEVRRFLELLSSANPTVLELLFTPADCLLDKHPAFDLILHHRNRFLTKQCQYSFGGYAIAQIKKATALDKKMNWESTRVERKTPLDFCYVYDDGKSLPLTTYLSRRSMEPQRCGLIKLDHIRDGYALYYDFDPYQQPASSSQSPRYRGICQPESNDLLLSQVTKAARPEAFLYWNRDGYSTHCKDYNDYQAWLKNRNTQRYVDNKGHNQLVDGKNLMHCRRLLDMAIEVAQYGELLIRRPNRDYLLAIRRGEVNLHDIIAKAEADILLMADLYASSALPDQVEHTFINSLLLEVRQAVQH